VLKLPLLSYPVTRVSCLWERKKRRVETEEVGRGEREGRKRGTFSNSSKPAAYGSSCDAYGFAAALTTNSYSARRSGAIALPWNASYSRAHSRGSA
jgi:hypothetical protein